MWRLTSFTFWFNLILLGVSVVDTPFISKDMGNVIFYTALANLGLREKTQIKVKK